MANRQYIGARYVPKFATPVEWTGTLSYEALTIVTHLGNSFTSKKPVPAGVDIGNAEYWVNTGNYNEQVATYKRDVDEVKTITITPEQFGAVGDGVTDDSAAFNRMFEFGAAHSAHYCLQNKNYLIKTPVSCAGNCFIDGNGGKILLAQTLIYGKVFINVTGDYVEIKNLSVEGYNTTDMWDTDHANMRWNTAFNITSDSVIINNVQFNNLWGNCGYIKDFSSCTISNVVSTNVGGKYKTNNEYDAFGDCFDFNTSKNNARVNISNVIHIGKVRGQTFSRCGFVFEYMPNATCMVNINNTTVMNCNRIIHTENTKNTKFYINNCDFMGDVILFATLNTGETDAFVENSNFITTGNEYSGTKSICRGYNLTCANCTFNTKGLFLFSGTQGEHVANFTGCKITSTGVLIQNYDAMFTNCDIDMSDVTVATYGCYVIANNCKINAPVNAICSNFTRVNAGGILVNKDNTCVAIVSDIEEARRYSHFTCELNGNVVVTPSIGLAIPSTPIFNDNTVEIKTAGFTVEPPQFANTYEDMAIILTGYNVDNEYEMRSRGLSNSYVAKATREFSGEWTIGEFKQSRATNGNTSYALNITGTTVSFAGYTTVCAVMLSA